MTVLQQTNPYSGAVIRLWDRGREARHCPAVEPHTGKAVRNKHHLVNRLCGPAWDSPDGSHALLPEKGLGVGSDGKPITEPSPYLAGNPTLANISQISGTESNGNQRYDALKSPCENVWPGSAVPDCLHYSKCMTDALVTMALGEVRSTQIRRTGRICTTLSRNGGLASLMSRTT